MPSLKTLPGLRACCAAVLASIFFVALATAEANFALMRELAGARYGADTARLISAWQQQIASMRPLSDNEKLKQTNDFFNARIRWSEDSTVWGKPDYWATPLELMGRGAGDCEDFAIAKYTTLRIAGVDVDKLRMTYVKAQGLGENGARFGAHMVLAYYPSPTAEPIILDNLITQILPASQRSDLTPVYGFNSKGIWVGGAAAPASTQPGTKLSRWRDLLARAAAEGLR